MAASPKWRGMNDSTIQCDAADVPILVLTAKYVTGKQHRVKVPCWVGVGVPSQGWGWPLSLSWGSRWLSCGSRPRREGDPDLQERGKKSKGTVAPPNGESETNLLSTPFRWSWCLPPLSRLIRWVIAIIMFLHV